MQKRKQRLKDFCVNTQLGTSPDLSFGRNGAQRIYNELVGTAPPPDMTDNDITDKLCELFNYKRLPQSLQQPKSDIKHITSEYKKEILVWLKQALSYIKTITNKNKLEEELGICIDYKSTYSNTFIIPHKKTANNIRVVIDNQDQLFLLQTPECLEYKYNSDKHGHPTSILTDILLDKHTLDFETVFIIHHDHDKTQSNTLKEKLSQLQYYINVYFTKKLNTPTLHVQILDMPINYKNKTTAHINFKWIVNLNL